MRESDQGRKDEENEATQATNIGKLLILVTLADSAFLIIMESERDAMLNECFTYVGQLRANGHFAGGEALQPPGAAMTLYWKNGKVAVTDGPYAETKEELSGILALAPRGLNRANELISQHPGVKYGPWNIRPTADLSEMPLRAQSALRGCLMSVHANHTFVPGTLNSTHCKGRPIDVGFERWTQPTQRSTLMEALLAECRMNNLLLFGGA